MNYTVSSLTTKADCQVLIDNADLQKSELEFKRVTIGRQAELAATNNADITADLAAVTAELAALQTVFNALPPGKTKDETQNKITKAAYRKFQLQQRHEKSGALALIEKQYDEACNESALTEINLLTQQLTDRMAELP